MIEGPSFRQDPNEAGELEEHMGTTPLVEAGDALDIVEVLLQARADVNQTGPCGQTALTNAVVCAGGAVQRLIDASADVNLPGAWDFDCFGPPLWHAAWKGSDGWIRSRASYRDRDDVYLLADAKADPNWACTEEDNVEFGSRFEEDLIVAGTTPLAISATLGTHQMASAFLDVRADPNKLDRWGRSPALVAARGNSETVLWALFSAGADLDLADNWERTPLWVAASMGHTRAVLTLLLAHVDVARADNWGRTPLHAALEQHVAPIVLGLLAYRADAEQPDRQGRTAKQILAQQHHPPPVKMLIERHLQS